MFTTPRTAGLTTTTTTIALTVLLAACGQTPPRPQPAQAGVRLLALDPAGVYTLRNACGDKLLDISGPSQDSGARAQLWTGSNGANQQWTLAAQDDGSYQLSSVYSGQVLDAAGWGSGDGTPVVQWPVNGGANQHWQVSDLGNGFTKLSPMHALGQALDAAGAGTADGTPVQLWTDNGSCAQQWQFQPVGASTPPTPPPAPTGRVLSVGADKPYHTLAAAVAAAQDGDTVQLDAGTYLNDFATINANITIEGVGGLAKLVASVPTEKAILVTNTDVTLRRLEFTGASNGDNNGAGIRYQGGHLVIERSYFHDNQDGLLAASDPGGSIRITRSEFDHNGAGDGRSHNIYVNEVGQFSFDQSYSHDAVVGHELKSRAQTTTITNSRLFDLSGDASYSIDVPNGGNLTVTGNVIEQGPRSENPFILTYGPEGLARPGREATISGNTFVNHLTARAPAGILNPAGVPMTVTNNTLYGLTVDQLLSGTGGVTTGNVVTTSEPALDTSHPF